MSSSGDHGGVGIGGGVGGGGGGCSGGDSGVVGVGGVGGKFINNSDVRICQVYNRSPYLRDWGSQSARCCESKQKTPKNY